MVLPLSQTCKTTIVSAGAAAGSNNVTGDGVDMAGCQGVLFTAVFGVIATNAVTGLKVQGDVESTFGNAVDLEGTLVAIADNGDNKCVQVDIHHPFNYQYLRPIVNRGTANATLQCIIAQQYGMSYFPATQNSTVVASETHVNPANGTA